MNICLIPARGGSKRIPYKNIKKFFGLPIIHYPIITAINSKVFDKVIVSTDDEKIINETKHFDIEIFNRSKETSTDEAMLADVICEYLDKSKEFIDTICCLLPCTPLINRDDLKDAYGLYNNTIDSIVPVVEYSQPYQRALFINTDKKVEMINKDFYNVRSQDLLSVYYDPGQFWILNTGSFKKYRKLYMPKSIPFLMSEENVQDVDTIQDWKILERKFRDKL